MFTFELPTSAGRRFADMPPRHIIHADSAAALMFAAQHDRRADHLLAESRFVQAESAAHLALEARCRALGVRA